jgi:hypothetical protein
MSILQIKELKHGVLNHTAMPVTGGSTPVIKTTQEAEIRRITVQSQHRQIVHETITKKGWWSGSRCRH